jgi:hypothetical protein
MERDWDNGGHKPEPAQLQRRHSLPVNAMLLPMFHRVAVIALILGASSSAAAHGGVPQSQAVLFDPDDADHILVPATFGLLETFDGGATWDWVCVQSIPSGRLGFVEPTVLTAGGAIFLAQRDGLRKSVGRGCAWSLTPTALDGSFVADVTVDASTGDILALQSDVATTNRIHRSTDGVSFIPLEGTIPGPFLPERLRTAPSDPSRIYVSGARPALAGAPAMPGVYVSDDSGVTWTLRPFVYEPDELDLFVLEVAAEDRDRVYAWVRGETTDRLVVSADAAASFTTIDTLRAAPVPNGRPFGFARADDGTLYYGNSEQGLLRTTDEIAIELISRAYDVACLARRGDTLFICANGLESGDGFSVGTAAIADPAAITPLLTFDRIAGVVSCDAPSDVTATCDGWWEDLLEDTGRPVPDAGAPDAAMPDAAVDASARDAGPADASVDASPDVAPSDTSTTPDVPGGGGCGCRISSRARGLAPGSSAFIALGLLLASRSRRARSRRRSSPAGVPLRPRRPPIGL